FLLALAPHPPSSPLFPYTTLFRSYHQVSILFVGEARRYGMVHPRFALAAVSTLVLAAGASVSSLPALAAPGIAFSTPTVVDPIRSEEHTSELQSRFDLVCRLLLEK